MVACSCVVLGCADDPVLRALTLVQKQRFTSGRFADSRHERSCIRPSARRGAARGTCGERHDGGRLREAELIAATAALHRSTATRVSDSGLRADALLELFWSSERPEGLERSVALLSEVARRTPSASAFNDLGVAKFARAEGGRGVIHLLDALESIEEALGIDTAFVPARFNRALILQGLHLNGSALLAWDAYLAREDSKPWRAEGRALRSALDSLPLGIPNSLDTQSARERGLILLGQALAARGSGATSTADSLTSLVHEVAESFRRIEGDASLTLALLALRQSRRGVLGEDRVASGLVALGAGLELHLQAAYDDAVPALTLAVTQLRGTLPAAEGWASYYLAAALVFSGKYAKAGAVLEHLLDGGLGYGPALRGKVHWIRGVSQVRRGAYELAMAEYRQALPLLEQAREFENASAVSYLLTETLLVSGERFPADEAALRGLTRLSQYRRSPYLTFHLVNVASMARENGSPRAALAVLDEALITASYRQQPHAVALVQLERARELATLSLLPPAWHAVGKARDAAQSIKNGSGRDRWMAETWLASARLHDDPIQARAAIDSAIRTLGVLRTDGDLARAKYQHAVVALRSADSASAWRSITESIDVLRRQLKRFVSTDSRAALWTTADEAFDLAIGLAVARGASMQALSLLEQSRALPWFGEERSQDLTNVKLHSNHEVVIAYAVLRDRLIVWALAADTSFVIVEAVQNDSLRALVQQRNRELETPGASNEAGRVLYDLLIRPLEPALSTFRTIVVVPDRELANVAFAALWDAHQSRYLVESHPIVTVPSITFFRDVEEFRRPSVSGVALVVGSPALDAPESAQLGDLVGARAEADQVARVLGVQPLIGNAARVDVVQRELGKASLFHFAGHAVTNFERPQQSFLALAPADGRNGRLTAAEIAKSRLSNLSLVVLSACRTLGPATRRGAPIAGLASSFLRAGAPAIVSTIGDVRDSDMQLVISSLYRHLNEGLGPSSALQRAQLEMMARSTAHPFNERRTWAALVYSGPST